MSPNDIIKLCLERYEGTMLVRAWGENSIFYNLGGLLKRGVYVMTIKEKDGDNDKSSSLNRDGIYRLNTGISKNSYISKFGVIPTRPLAGGVVLMWIMTLLNKILSCLIRFMLGCLGFVF